MHMAQRSSELVSKVSLKVQDDTTRTGTLLKLLTSPVISCQSCRIDICRGDGSIYGKILEHEQPQRALDEAGKILTSLQHL